VNLVYLTGPAGLQGPFLAATAICRSLHAHGFRVAPLYLGPPAAQRFPCTGGGSISRYAAILAEACGQLPQTRFEGGAPDLFDREFDWLVIQSPQIPPTPLDHCRTLTVSPDGAGWTVDLGGRTLSLPPAPDICLAPELTPEVEALPPYLPGSPRIGVVSWPHIANFDDFLHVPGAEWIAFPLPGRLDVIFLPDSSDRTSDTEWLGLQGIDNWLMLQTAMGCRIVSTGFPWPSARRTFGPGEIRDANQLSIALGARVSPSLPPDGDIDGLARWWEDAFGSHPDSLAL
jgi:hypothetical protein